MLDYHRRATFTRFVRSVGRITLATGSVSFLFTVRIVSASISESVQYFSAALKMFFLFLPTSLFLLVFFSILIYLKHNDRTCVGISSPLVHVLTRFTFARANFMAIRNMMDDVLIAQLPPVILRSALRALLRQGKGSQAILVDHVQKTLRASPPAFLDHTELFNGKPPSHPRFLAAVRCMFTSKMAFESLP